FGAKKTMQVAQNLYEGVDIGGETVGLITYMRTDSVALAQEAVTAIRALIEKEYGKNYLPDTPRFYKNNSKNAQEAHEAIRPTNVARTPETIAGYLTSDQRKLYELIWKRTVACQMASALMDKVGVDIPSSDGALQLRATGQTIAFAGFIKLYKEDIDDDKGEDDTNLLPVMNEQEPLETLGVRADQHFTEPPPRFSEASLVKKLEELGIGRPSTYATILSVLQEREYVRLENKRFVPQDRGRIVTAFMENYFNQYIQYDYTANLENKLDDITNDKIQWKEVLKEFWSAFNSTVRQVAPVKMGDVLETVAKTLEKHLFPTEESRLCPECKHGKLSLRVGRFGAFIGCSDYPTCKYTKPFAQIEPPKYDENGQPIEPEAEERKNISLGRDENGLEITVKKGPYGWYVQRGDGKEAKRTGLPKDMSPDSVDFKKAMALLSLPRILGKDPKSQEIIEAGLGKFGAYVRCGKTYGSLTADDDVLTITSERALELLSGAKKKAESKKLGKWNDQEVTYQIGRFGPYVKCGKLMASAKKDGTIPTLDEAVKLLQDKMHQK
ncbi:MAG: DNA topoisomerase, partial [Alphaproteobacteria bacterium]